MDRRPPRERKKRRKKKLGYSMVFLSLAAIAGAGWYVFIAAGGKQLDEDLCPAEEGPSSVHVVIVDATDPYNPIQWQNVKNRLSRLKGEIPKHGLLTVFSVTQSVPETLEPEIELCNPGSGEQLSIWTGNPKLARQRWERSFVAPIDSIFSSIETEEPRRRSPIMETIQAAKARVGSYDTDSPELTVVSDMMQHTRQYSHYRAGPPSYDGFESRAVERKLSADLSGWTVEILYIRRSRSEVQGRSHAGFWEQYFSENGALLQRVKRVDG
jgi:hypothetical protein